MAVGILNKSGHGEPCPYRGSLQNHAHLHVNRAGRYDPTRTSGLRQRFAREMNKRFGQLKKDIHKSIVDNDCFGIQRPDSAFWGLMALPPGAFAFMRDPDKIMAFMTWLEEQEGAGILQRIIRPYTNRAIEAAWTDTYIDTAYAQGLRRARMEMHRAGLQIELFGEDLLGRSAMGAALGGPIHADALGVLYMRTFEDLKSVTQFMNADIRRLIADGLRSGLTRGLAEGKNPNAIARELVRDVANRVDKIGITRARMIARTEIIRAHHVATINEYRRADSEMQVRVQAEWSTAGDDRVCDICASLQGKIYTLDQIEGMIPRHPNCRCAAIPYVERLNVNGRIIFMVGKTQVRRLAA